MSDPTGFGPDDAEDTGRSGGDAPGHGIPSPEPAGGDAIRLQPPPAAAPRQAGRPDRPGPPPRRRATSSDRGSRRACPPDRLVRLPIVAALAGALIVGGLIDHGVSHGSKPAAASADPFPAVAPPAALSSSWFCAGATDTASGNAPGSVILANDAATPATAIVNLVTNKGTSGRVPVTVNAYSRTVVPETVKSGAAWIGAIVDVDAGAVAVQQLIDGPLGRASSPCATAGSSQWYFTSGATLVNASVVISLLNPYPTSAVADMGFVTDQGQEFPAGFQGLVVPPNGLLTVNLGDHLRRRQTIATTITARSGRLVAWKTDVVTQPRSGEPLIGTPAGSSPLADPASPTAGVTLTLGAPATATSWAWPEGDSGNGVNEQYVIYNPGLRTAQLQLSIALDAGEAEPFQVSVGPGLVVTLTSNQQVRIPPGVGHAALLQSLNGVPVVAERTISATAPSPWYGLGEIPGSALIADDWLLPYAQTNQNHDGWLYVYNPNRVPVSGDLTGLNNGTPVAFRHIAVGAGRRVSIHLNPLAARSLTMPLTVDMTGPVFVEVDYYGVKGTPGLNLSLGVPVQK